MIHSCLLHPGYHGSASSLAIAALPGTVVVLVPLWIIDRYDVPIVWPRTAGALALVLLGGVLSMVGGTLFVASLRRFAGEVHGTMAPWDPPGRFVVRGPYHYVRIRNAIRRVRLPRSPLSAATSAAEWWRII